MQRRGKFANMLTQRCNHPVRFFTGYLNQHEETGMPLHQGRHIAVLLVDQPDTVVDLFDAHGLTRERSAEIDFPFEFRSFRAR